MITVIVQVKLEDGEIHEFPCDIGISQGKIVMELPNLRIKEFSFLPSKARELADGLKHYAEEAERGRK